MANKKDSFVMGGFGCPVTLFIFNRPIETEKVFQRIRSIKPSRLFIVSDGPRLNNEVETDLVLLCREIVSRIDWECEISTNFSDHNMGCRRRVISGLDWVFSMVEYSIILEDDCLPHPDFFSFADELLQRFANDERVGAISGTNLLLENSDSGTSYLFSRFPSIWGWGTWGRVWKMYDGEILDWPEQQKAHLLRETLSNKRAIDHWERSLNGVYNHQIDTWDYQFAYLLWKTKQLSVIPRNNLISNIGFGANATHTFDKSSPMSNMATFPMSYPLVHPSKVATDSQFDHEIQSQLTPALWRWWASRLMHILPVSLAKLVRLIYKQLWSHRQ